VEIFEDIKLLSGTMGGVKVPDLGNFHANSMAATRDLPGRPHDAHSTSVVCQKSRSGLMLALCIEVEVARRCERSAAATFLRPPFWVPGI